MNDVAEVLTRAQSLYAPEPAVPRDAGPDLAAAADAVRSEQSRAADMSGTALENFGDVAGLHPADLEMFAAAESRLSAAFAQAAELQATGGASTAALLDSIDRLSDLGALADSPAAERAVLTAVLALVRRQQQLLSDQQQQARELADGVGGLF